MPKQDEKHQDDKKPISLDWHIEKEEVDAVTAFLDAHPYPRRSDVEFWTAAFPEHAGAIFLIAAEVTETLRSAGAIEDGRSSDNWAGFSDWPEGRTNRRRSIH